MEDSSGLPSALEVLKGDEFYKESHRIIFTAIQDLFEQNEPVDILTVTNLLSERKQLESVGGASYIAALTDAMPRSSNVAAYAKIISEKAVLRRLIQSANEIISFAYGGGKSTEEVLDSAEAAIFRIAERQDPKFVFSAQRSHQKEHRDDRTLPGISGERYGGPERLQGP